MPCYYFNSQCYELNNGNKYRALHYNAFPPHITSCWMSSKQIPWYLLCMAALGTVILNSFDTTHVSIVPRSKKPLSTCPSPLQQKAIYWVSLVQGHLASPRQAGSWKQQVLQIVVSAFGVWLYLYELQNFWTESHYYLTVPQRGTVNPWKDRDTRNTRWCSWLTWWKWIMCVSVSASGMPVYSTSSMRMYILCVLKLIFLILQ